MKQGGAEVYKFRRGTHQSQQVVVCERPPPILPPRGRRMRYLVHGGLACNTSGAGGGANERGTGAR